LSPWLKGALALGAIVIVARLGGGLFRLTGDVVRSALVAGAAGMIQRLLDRSKLFSPQVASGRSDR
jgi:hypothetical protein